MRIFVTGVGGQLGHDVMNELAKRGYEGVGSDIAPSYSGIADGTAVTTMPYVQMDITDKASVEKVIKEANVDAVIHCAAWTAVDAAEDEENQPKVRLVNVTGTQNIADVCKELDIKMLYLSTDYVFDGQGTTPWEPDCKDYKPLNVYGQTKLDGELAVSGTVDKFFIFPLPEVPTIATNSPFSTSRFIPSRALTSVSPCPYIFRKFTAFNIFMPSSHQKSLY